MKQNVIWGVVAVALLVVGVNFPLNGTTVTERVIQQVVGSGQTDSAHKFFSSNATLGGYYATTSGVTLSAYTLTGDTLRDKSVVAWTNNHDITISIGATSTFDLIPAVGDTATVYFRNASTTAASAITFAAKDTSVDLQFAEASGGDLVLNGLDWEKVTFIRNALTGVSAVTVIVDEMTEAD